MRSNVPTSVLSAWAGAALLLMPNLAIGEPEASTQLRTSDDAAPEDPCSELGTVVRCDATAFRLLENDHERLAAEAEISARRLADVQADLQLSERLRLQDRAELESSIATVERARGRIKLAWSAAVIGTGTLASGLAIAASGNQALGLGLLIGGLAIDGITYWVACR